MNYLAKCASKHPQFREMHELSLASFRRHLEGNWELLLVDFPESAAVMPDLAAWKRVYERGFHVLLELWKQGHSVFSTDADTLLLKPLDIFNSSEQMRLYWDTAAPCCPERWPHYLNAGVMYFPASMKEAVWEVGLRQIVELRADWDHIQMIYNDMFWSQNPVPALDPAMNYSPHVDNPITCSGGVKIMHFHASRDRERTLERMREMSKQTVNA